MTIYSKHKAKTATVAENEEINLVKAAESEKNRIPQLSASTTEPAPALFVSSSLMTFETTIDEVYCPTEIIIDDVALRRLDARYYAYLVENLKKAEKAYQKDKLPAAAMAFALARFAKVEKWAREHIGEERIKAAIEE